MRLRRNRAVAGESSGIPVGGCPFRAPGASQANDSLSPFRGIGAISCDRYTADLWRNGLSHIDWAERLIGAGYVALLVESNTARGSPNNCSNPPPIKYDQQVVDAGVALEHLRRLPIVDRNRLGVMGLSFGAGVGLRMASESYQRALPYGADGLRAVASFYPWCARAGRGFDSRDIFTEGLPSDIVTPTIMFLGAIDDETLPRPCTERADRMKAEGKPINYKLYPDTTHSFDSREIGLAGRTVRGRFFYRYNPAATEDAWRELKDFFERNLKRP